ncbi:MAG: exopolysaccharide biosynthesis protein [Opitutaceae bacterium]|nr:exopolysaccharide biosynthesis protein [Opitutaceae bacterium]
MAPRLPRLRLRPLPPARKLSEELAELRAEFADHEVTLRAVLVALRGRAYMLLILLMTLPFLLPLPLPGLSTPFGFAIMLIALRLTLGQRPWLPKRIQRLTIPSGFFPKVIDGATRIIRLLESFLKPRWLILTESGLLLRLHALVMLGAASILLLPLPVPFSNGLPAWAILFLASGLLERDGWFIALGYLMLVLSVVYLWIFGEAAAHGLEALIHWIRS